MNRIYVTLTGLWSKIVFLLMVFSFSGGVAYSSPIQWSGNEGNGHWYEVVRLQERNLQDMTWEAACNYASGLTYGGFQGHLVTITSEGEDTFIVGNLVEDSDSWIWLGGYQTPEGGNEPDENWHWVTGETWSYTNWDWDEPNDYLGVEESYLMMWGYEGDIAPGTWNDTSNDPKSILIVEYDQPTPAPEPASLLLLSSGLIVFAYRLRKD
ncbi:MAG TPA: PEP-CTERM sorting domain-containing protein [Desulfobacterales bacterium]|nr:PEP-CTERM sorting domain-containing protein [Desulfobacterales bacterium]